MEYIKIPTRDEYWGQEVTAEQAERGARALQTVLKRAAELLHIDAEITLSPNGGPNYSENDSLLIRIDEAVWTDDNIQTVAFEGGAVDADAVLTRFNDDCIRCGGTGYAEFANL
jgi:hypothetical protein